MKNATHWINYLRNGSHILFMMIMMSSVSCGFILDHLNFLNSDKIELATDHSETESEGEKENEKEETEKEKDKLFKSVLANDLHNKSRLSFLAGMVPNLINSYTEIKTPPPEYI